MRLRAILPAAVYLFIPTVALTADEGVFGLGEITVTSSRLRDVALDTSVVTQEQLATFARATVDDAMALIPGTTGANSGGSRNERLIYVRGYDRLQVPISIDGIRVYLPADNRLDFGRFVTGDLAEIQVAKGYVSVLDGPGALGGAINLVTRKPVREFEAEASAGLRLDGGAQPSGYDFFGLLGTRQENYYVQASFARTMRDYYSLSDDFTPTVNENGGERNNSASRDWRANLKLGYLPNGTDEYTLSFTKQEGAKNAPFHITDPLAAQRFWRWPIWDISSVYFLSNTRVNESVSLKTRLYYNTFYNLLSSYDNANFTTQTINPRTFNSYYDDIAWGGSAEVSFDIAPTDTLKAAFHYRSDRHVEWQQLFAPAQIEPDQVQLEDTYSVAVENIWRVSEQFDVVLGASQDWRNLKRAEDWTRTVNGAGVVTASSFVSYPLADADAFNFQGEAIYRLGAGSLHAGVSQRTRFPTIFERFSTRFGGATSNPNLGAEKAIHYEIGYNGAFGGIRFDGAIFHSELTDAIASVNISAVPFGGAAGTFVAQSQNVGSGRSTGFEFALETSLKSWLEAGANYTYIDRRITDPNNAIFRATGVPRSKGLVYATATVVPGLEITPSVEFASARYTSNTAATLYYKTGAYTLFNLAATIDVTERTRLSLNARNLFDTNYQLVDGFPEEGRSFLMTLSWKN